LPAELPALAGLSSLELPICAELFFPSARVCFFSQDLPDIFVLTMVYLLAVSQ
jgi:hypothetical protein